MWSNDFRSCDLIGIPAVLALGGREVEKEGSRGEEREGRREGGTISDVERGGESDQSILQTGRFSLWKIFSS